MIPIFRLLLALINILVRKNVITQSEFDEEAQKLNQADWIERHKYPIE
jgi:hypothetical protein